MKGKVTKLSLSVQALANIPDGNDLGVAAIMADPPA